VQLRVADATDASSTRSPASPTRRPSARPSAGSSSGSSSRRPAPSWGVRRAGRVPRPGHALPRRRRVRRRRRHLQHQEPPQRRRPARRPAVRARRAAAGAVQGRGPPRRHRARAARGDRVAPAFPGPGLGIRIIGEVTAARLELLRRADAIAGPSCRPRAWTARSGSARSCCSRTYGPSGCRATGGRTATPWCCGRCRRRTP
jgi:hypothetical protein